VDRYSFDVENSHLLLHAGFIPALSDLGSAFELTRAVARISPPNSTPGSDYSDITSHDLALCSNFSHQVGITAAAE
jgi:hypothetical protein